MVRNMKKTNSFSHKFLSITFVVLIAAIVLTSVLTFSGCGAADTNPPAGQQSSTEAPKELSFKFIVRLKDGTETSFDIKTTKTIVGDALSDEKLIEGEEGPFGLYVKKVNGVEADFDKDGTYWAFYINGEYAATGVDKTKIKDGATYMFAVES